MVDDSTEAVRRPISNEFPAEAALGSVLGRSQAHEDN